MKKAVILFLFLLIQTCAIGQDSNMFLRRNSLQLELSGGDASFIPISINYERILLMSNKIAWNGKVGGIYKPWGNNPQKAATFELGMVSLGSKHHWELGLFTMLQDRKSYMNDDRIIGTKSPPWYLAARGGYRYQRPDGKWLFRIGILLPFLRDAADDTGKEYRVQFKYQNILIPWPAISFGRAF